MTACGKKMEKQQEQEKKKTARSQLKAHKLSVFVNKLKAGPLAHCAAP